MKHRWLAALLAALLVASCGPQSGSTKTVMRVAVTPATTPLMNDLLAAYRRTAPGVSFEITRGNADTVRMALTGGTVEWGLVTHLPAESDLWSAPVGLDALAVVVHPENTLPGLTRGQVRAIFQGHTHTWAELGGPDAPITVISREPGSAAREAFDEFVMGGVPTTPAARLATHEEAVLNLVGEEPGAVGYLSLVLVDTRVRPLTLDGVAPSPEAARSGRYPLTTVIRFVARAEPSGPAGDFLTWLLSEEGQAIVGQRYAPLAR